MSVQQETRIGAGVDVGWGRAAAEFATLSEPANCREYVTVHHRLKVDEGDRLLDGRVRVPAWPSRLGRGYGERFCAGIDASRPADRGRARPQARTPDIRGSGDMNALPWDTGSFDVVTSFRGIWGHHAGGVHGNPPRPGARGDVWA